MADPCRPGLRFASLDALVADVDQLRSSEIEQCGQWSLAMILDHLVKWTAGMLDGGLPSVPGFVQSIARLMVHRVVRKQVYPTVKLKAIKVLQPGSSPPLDWTYGEFIRMVERVRKLPGSVVHTQPFGGLSRDDFQRLMLLHAAHHLAFLRRRLPSQPPHA